MEYKILANEDAIKKILSKGVKNMPQNPAACGYKPDQIRKFYYETEELTLELMKAIEENIYKTIVNYAAFEHPKTYIGVDYPNIQGVQGGETWTITLPKYTGWTWKDRSIQLQADITITLSEMETEAKRLAYAYVFFKGSETDTNEYPWVTYVTSPDAFIVVAQSAIPSLDLTQYRFICVAKLPIYKDNKYSTIPSLDMGGLPFKWNDKIIVENIEVNKRIDELEKKINNGSGSNLNTTPIYGSIKKFARELYNNGKFYIMVPFHTTESISDVPNWATGYAMGYICIAYSQIWIEITERATNKIYRCNWVHHETITADTDLSTIVGKWSDWEVCCKDIAVDTKLSTESENPVQNKVVAEALNGKVTAIKNTVGEQAYTQNASNETVLTPVSEYATSNTIVKRNNSGRILTVSPVTGNDCANKTYVDTLLENRVTFEDYPSSTKAGVICVSGLNYGLEWVDSQKALRVREAKEEIIKARSGYRYEAVTLGKVDSVIKEVLINPLVTMSPEEQRNAQAWLGVSGGLFKYIHNLDFSDANGVLHRVTGISKFGTLFTYVQYKGICLGTFNADEHPDIFNTGLQPDVLLLTSAFINNISEIVSPPRAEFSIEESADWTERTIYLTKIEDIDLININNFYTVVREV